MMNEREKNYLRNQIRNIQDAITNIKIEFGIDF